MTDLRLLHGADDEGQPDDGPPIDPDLSLAVAYVSGELSLVERAAFDERLGSDAAFRARVQPVLDIDALPVTFAGSAPLPRVVQGRAATDAEIDAGWRRMQASSAPPAIETPRRPRRIPSRFARAAAVLLAVVLPVIGIAQVIGLLRGPRPAPVVTAPRGDGRRAVALTPVPANPALSAPAPWQLSAAPLLVLGERRDPRARFVYVRSAVRLSAGEIAVADGGALDVRVFDASGRSVRTVGARGTGAGEFDDLEWVGRQHDTLFLYDEKQRRLSTLAAPTGGIRQTPVAPFAGVPEPELLARFGDGTMLMQTTQWTSMRHPDGAFRDTVALWLLPPTLTNPVRLGAFPKWSHLAFNPTNSERAGSVGLHRFGPMLMFAATGDRLWFCDSGTGELVAYDTHGRVLTRTMVPIGRAPFDEGVMTRLLTRSLAAAHTAYDSAYVRARFERRNRPATRPAFAEVIGEADGSVWLARYQEDPAAPRSYVVVDRSGRHVADVASPADFRITDIGPDYVVGVATGPDRAETVRVYRLAR